MIARVVAWFTVATVLGLIWQYGNQWRSPWAVISSPVLSHLPPAAPACAEGCK